MNARETIILRIADGKIAEEWNAADLLGLLKQLGAVPAFSLDGASAPEAVKPPFDALSEVLERNPAVLEGAPTFENSVKNLRLATDRFVNGNTADWKDMCSQCDVSVAGRAGGCEVG